MTLNKGSIVAEPAISVAPVAGKADFNAFIDLGFRLNRSDPNWVPPLRSEVVEMLTPGKNPFHEHATMQLFLARRNGAVVGRISAHIDHLALAQPAEQGMGPGTGNWGLLEAEDEEVTHALITAAEGWLKLKGMTRVLAAEFVNRSKAYRAVHYRNGYYAPEGNNLRKAFLRAPLEFSRVSSGFGMRRHPIARAWRAGAKRRCVEARLQRDRQPRWPPDARCRLRHGDWARFHRGCNAGKCAERRAAYGGTDCVRFGVHSLCVGRRRRGAGCTSAAGV